MFMATFYDYNCGLSCGGIVGFLILFCVVICDEGWGYVLLKLLLVYFLHQSMALVRN